MLTFLFAVVLGWNSQCEAAKRPITFVADGSLTEGPAENFRELFVDPRRLNKILSPLTDSSATQPHARVTKNEIALSDRVFFAPNSHTIKPSSAVILDAVAKVMERRADIDTVQISGFSNAQDKASSSLALSVRRTNAVVNHLVARGVDKERLTTLGFGGGSAEQAQPKDQPLQFTIQRWKDVPSMQQVEKLGEDAPPATTSTSKTGSLLITNEAMTFADVTVNGIKIGVIGPLTEAALHGLPSGLYDVGFIHPTGFTYYRSQHTGTVNSPIVPGGKRAVTVLPNNGLPAPENAVREAAE